MVCCGFSAEAFPLGASVYGLCTLVYFLLLYKIRLSLPIKKILVKSVSIVVILC